ncbi:MAG: VanZ family protein [Gammaproteobacteria bacterium]|nr:VanZ family protein [Gammaproteobacteria bacterium]
MPHKPTRYFLLWLAWAVLIIYGSLMPFEVRPHTLTTAIEQFRHIPYLNLGIVSRADWIANILLYIPLAYLGVTWLSQLRWLPRFFALIIPAGLGFALAVGVEFTQIFFEPRTVSLNDLIAESIGTLLGVVLWSAGHSRLASLTSALVRPGPAAVTAGLTLYSLAYLSLALFPYDFVISMSDLQWKLLNGNYGWGIDNCGSVMRCGSQWLAEAVAALPLGLLLIRLLQHGMLRPAFGFLIAAGIGTSIEAAQFLISSGVSTVTAALAKAAGIGLGLWLRDPPSPQLAQYHARWLRPALLLAFFPYLALAALLNGWTNASWNDFEIVRNNLSAQHYLPLYYHYFTTETEAVASLVAQTAIYLPLGIGFWLWHASGATPLRQPPLFGLLLTTAVTAFIIEAGKLFIAHSHPDPTNILIALGAAWLGRRLCQWLAESIRATARNSDRIPSAIHFPRKALIGIGLVILSLGGLGLVLIQETEDSEAVVMARIKHEYPAPESLPPASLPNFRLDHPRLPAPSMQDIIRLKSENPRFIDMNRAQANGGHGNLNAAILMAYVEPGSQDLDAVFNQLIAIKPSWRGHEQGKLFALAYDWLYSDWSESQRQQLRDKLAHGCNYLIDVIRSAPFSPYNVTLYTGPIQALMACSIALYKDDSRGEPVMAFTADLWQNRALPVWRQVMGKNGGWHEGADHVGEGIGQAIYQLPNMWRSATGEDYFKTESGIRGFLDFLVYRIRPDGAKMHLGDSGSFNRDAPDRLALALEYHHTAAYSLATPPKDPVPTSWPWGPLSDNRLYEPNAITQLPLTRYFDGIGLVVMRSGWGPDATYITFKAGDNYSSFTHLDQGSFTLYKGGALAIDSGLYDDYGTDHHVNYAYQTIAHNVATITDPDESGAISNNDFNSAPRPIANDGGQRRVGGDIEIYPNPLDIAEWKARRDIYHTGSITHLQEKNGVVSITADITAAYTNKFSGEGTLSSRTLRVNRYLRTVIYDRINDLFLVYDSITKTNPSFTSRWLIHFQEQPVLTAPNQFLASVLPDNNPKHTGGILEGKVLIPGAPVIKAIGGPGKEFWVDGKNYDNNGKLYKILNRGNRKQITEPGDWRIEITNANEESLTDNFLVALNLKQNRSDLTPSIQCSQGGGLTDCIVRGKREMKLQVKWPPEKPVAYGDSVATSLPIYGVHAIN